VRFGPSDDNLRFSLFDERKLFMSEWDIPWCLGEDFNVGRSPYGRSTEGRLSSAMLEFYDFINSCGLIELPLEDGCFTWSGHEDVPVLSRIDCFLFSIECEGHCQGVHQVILPKIISDHFQILLWMGTTHVAKRSFKFENVWLEVDGFCDFVKDVWDSFNASSSLSFIL